MNFCGLVDSTLKRTACKCITVACLNSVSHVALRTKLEVILAEFLRPSASISCSVWDKRWREEKHFLCETVQLWRKYNYAFAVLSTRNLRGRQSVACLETCWKFTSKLFSSDLTYLSLPLLYSFGVLALPTIHSICWVKNNWQEENCSLVKNVISC